MSFQIKRVYDPPAGSDGRRILVDRLWPRGLKKSEARLDTWLKDIAPSPALRNWFGHKPQRFAEFARRYRAELKGSAALATLGRLGRRRVTLLYGARDPKVNHARVLLALLNRRAPRPAKSTSVGT